MFEYVPTAPLSFITATLSRAARRRVRSRSTCRAHRATFAPNVVGYQARQQIEVERFDLVHNVTSEGERTRERGGHGVQHVERAFVTLVPKVHLESAGCRIQKLGPHAGPAPRPPAASDVRLDRDFSLYYRLAPDVPARVELLTHRREGDAEGTFMAVVTPGSDLAPVEKGTDWAFVLDMSGSMSGKYQTLVDGVQRALGKLGSNDRFRLFRFNNAASELTPGWIDATPERVTTWSNRLAASGVNGGTNLYAGLGMALDNLDADRTSVIVLVTDGEANVGVTDKRDFLDLMKQHDVRLFTAVMGNGSNRPLLEAMTEALSGALAPGPLPAAGGADRARRQRGRDGHNRGCGPGSRQGGHSGRRCGRGRRRRGRRRRRGPARLVPLSGRRRLDRRRGDGR